MLNGPIVLSTAAASIPPCIAPKGLLYFSNTGKRVVDTATFYIEVFNFTLHF